MEGNMTSQFAFNVKNVEETVMTALSYSSGLDRSALTLSMPIADLALDSVSQMALGAVIEAELSISRGEELSEAILGAETVGDLIAVCTQLVDRGT